MRYRNTKTGAIVDSPFKIFGEDWEVFKPKKDTEELTGEYTEEEIDLEAMTKAELIELAKEHNIEVDEKATKAVIIETIAKSFE
ncbi:hypothetical protein LI012_06435 [Caldibacillus thermoamylovorans]|uniref:Rho termination factor N-terminal domain-containing protein n=1 Tax=Caldibacillus thermoamylovorans TaxID=35841 RepID=UPI001D093C93|nr:Rho termination factor N-terminal domain-containing protein [Caldibacillus thermoamylovorans]MCB5934490.1 hypothetical protein [Bacillus sp. DFI.2.34]MCB7076465.1 hypothetical protein [Caldibacillus thermoamylovorans]